MKRIVIVLLVLLEFAACSPSKQLSKIREQAEEASINREYEKSLLLWEQIIANDEASQKQANTDSYEKAGNAALALGQLEKSETYFKLAVYYKTASPQTYQYLAGFYRQQENLSKEVAMLEPLLKNFPNSSEAKVEKLHLYWRYIETDQYEKALALWPPVDEADSDEKLLESLFTANKKTGNEDQLDQIADTLLLLNNANLLANEFKALNYYNKAEDRYRSELEAYEKQKTGKQYKIMLVGLDEATIDFKKALKLFEKLYLGNQNKKYALYMANIYARFGDEKQSLRYRKLAE